jgi:hypothetical protein
VCVRARARARVPFRALARVYVCTYIYTHVCTSINIVLLVLFNYCPSLLEIIGIRVPNRNFLDFLSLYANVFSHEICSSARCASSVNIVCKDTDIFRKQADTLHCILK